MYVHNIMCKCVHTGIVLLCGCIAKICCGVVILQQSQCSERCSSCGSVLASSFIEYVSSVLQSIYVHICVGSINIVIYLQIRFIKLLLVFVMNVLV